MLAKKDTGKPKAQAPTPPPAGGKKEKKTAPLTKSEIMQ